MYLIDRLVEKKLAEATERGEFDALPGHGKPLELDDDSMVPESLRAGYRLLKNAGYLPAELQLRREIADVETLIRQAEDGEHRAALNRRLLYLIQQLKIQRPAASLLYEDDYGDQLNRRLQRE
ncbi:MAG: DUF1992 domain-containing protein [Gammaproteobacteria bacterium]|nr:DUF1992 domain-containing protein [Gammaproteobacteria bacterium]